MVNRDKSDGNDFTANGSGGDKQSSPDTKLSPTVIQRLGAAAITFCWESDPIRNAGAAVVGFNRYQYAVSRSRLYTALFDVLVLPLAVPAVYGIFTSLSDTVTALRTGEVASNRDDLWYS